MINTRNVAILVFDDVEVLDFAGPFEVFNVAGEILKPNPFPVFFTYTVSLTGEMVIARGGLRVTPHFGLANCPQPDILIIPGGYGARRLIKNPPFIQWLSTQAQQVENLLSVCTGALALAKADLLTGLSATTHHGAFHLLSDLSPTTTVITDQRFVQNGNIFTSGGISAGIDLSLAVVAMLVGKENADMVRDQMEWGWHSQS